MQTVAMGERSADESRVWTIPNALSIARLVTVPFFVWLFVTDRKDAAVLLYAIAAWTDFFDGYIARRTGSVTELGRLLDPLADRIFIAALAIALVATGVLSGWIAGAIVARDVVILAAYPLVQKGLTTKIRVNFTGKTATAALLLGLTLLAVSETSIGGDSVIDEIGYAFVVLGAVGYWVAGGMYAHSAYALTRGAGR
ncbi:MAG TPA: CDP-alcohol phosphatidyltransferase family protein [Actinomycetota bacterium]|nr:CDP-alcohol phosphatidyltransferase family protein [Actinomycetota bacterium]